MGLVTPVLSLFILACPIHGQTAPLIAAHRGGTADGPENTIIALQNSLTNGADLLWMTVQLSSDGVPVLYRPADVSAQTEGKGLVNTLTAAQLGALNAGMAFSQTDAMGNKTYPYRDHPVRIPTLKEALRSVPNAVPILVDMKQLPAAPLVNAIARVLDAEHAWPRVRFYSTDPELIRLMAAYPQAQLFETRDATRDRLASVALTGDCAAPPPAGTWVGIELDRKVTLVEKFTLGEGISTINAHWWTPAAVSCFRTNSNVKIVTFGVDSRAAYTRAEKLGVDIVMTDSPSIMKAIRDAK
ncbi:MAG: glycerophosphodiester phosphodiesterase [Glaciimonas sp.]|nr:glycerophosphodiester phosphodiesterase [Glaciimonas sp.]